MRWKKKLNTCYGKFDTGKNNTQMERKEKQFPSYDKK